MTIADLLIRKLCLDGGTQKRVALDRPNVADLRELLQAGEELDPIEVIFDKLRKIYFVVDGFHRVEAHAQEGRKAIRARVTPGTQRDAILASVGANARHGLRRSNADKRLAVETLLIDPEWQAWSNREIARRCGVDETMVRKLRAELSAVEPQMRTAQRGDVSYEMDVSGLSPEGRLRLQQKLEERARKEREAEERKAAEAAANDQAAKKAAPEITGLFLEIPLGLWIAIERAAHRRKIDLCDEAIRTLEEKYLGPGKKRRA